MEENINITPEMIYNLVNKLKSDVSSNSNTSFEPNSQTKSTSDKNSNNIDFETILKIKSVIENLNKKDDPRSNLLYSLKPYLRESRQKKLDQYVSLLKIAQITDLLKNEKGD